MFPKIQVVGPLPAYHPDLLVVKTRPGPSALTVATAEAATAAMAGSPGFSALSYYERSGMIKRVVHLSARALSAGPAGTGTALAAFALSHPAGSAGRAAPNAGVSLVELQPNSNMRQLQASLASDPLVASAAPVPIRYLMAKRQPTAARRVRPTRAAAAAGMAPAATPPPASSLWNLQKINWRQAYSQLDPAKSIRVAVLDTGVDPSHPDLPGTEITYVHDYPDSQVSTSDQDAIGHGTHVSGTIRALIDNGIGIDGICQCKLSVYKIFGDDPAQDPVTNPFPYYPYYVDPILYRAALAAAHDAGLQVINLSIGGPAPPDPQEQALFQGLIDSGVAVIAAMGNESSSQPSYPAAIPGVIAVGATALDDSRADFSNIGAHIALSAPGVGIWSTLPTYPGQTGFYAIQGPGGTWVRGAPMRRETDYDSWQGTSMATPHVTATAALAAAKYGSLAAAAMKTRLMQAVDKVPGMQGQDFTKEYGAGRLNLLKL